MSERIETPGQGAPAGTSAARDMRGRLSVLRQAVETELDRATRLAGRLDRSRLAWMGLALAAIVFLAINVVGSTLFRSARIDLTSEGLYTISEGTRRALAAIDEPIDLRLYFSRQLGELAPTYQKNFERVRTLLEQYRALSGNRLRVSYLDPVPFSDAEDRAVAAGLRGIRLNQDGDLGYFGLAGSNSTDNEATIAFFAPDRERFIEYDVTKLVASLANPKKRVVGLISSLPLDGGLDPVMGMRGRPQPPQLVMEQIREVLEVRTLDKDIREVPAGIDVLMIVQPDGLSAQAAYAIDQFVLAGGKALVFLDPVSEVQRASRQMMPALGPRLGDFEKVLRAWGVAMDTGVVAGDIRHARRVQYGAQRGQVTEYVPWLALDKRNLDQRDVLAASIERMNIGSAGILEPVQGATTTVAPLIQTSADAMRIPADKVAMMPDPVGLLRAYRPEGKPLMLAARISGDARSAFPDGAPKSEPQAGDAKSDGASADATKSAAAETPKPAGETATDNAAVSAASSSRPHVAEGRVNVVVVADTDLLADQFWVDVRELLGQQVAIPHAHNAAFAVGALEHLSGSEALLGLRGRGVTDRPFELVDNLRRDAERRYREKEEALTSKLKEVQGELAKLERTGEGGSVILTEKDRQSIERLRAEMLGVRRELRDVKLALRQDIDRLDGWLKFANIAFVPLLIGLGALGLAIWRRREARS